MSGQWPETLGSSNKADWLLSNIQYFPMDSLSRNTIFFVGIAGTGMSAIAQYLHGIGKIVSGSDREFGRAESNAVQIQFEGLGLLCFPQDGSGIDTRTELVVVSTAIEETNIEYQKAVQLGIPIIKRSALLADICASKKTIAVGGTSGKSTTAAMIFHILQYCKKEPSLITGAGLSSLQEQGLPGNAWVGASEWLVIEADESDGSIVGYEPYISVLLNVDRDHKEFDELMSLFTAFKNNTTAKFIVNQDDRLASTLSVDEDYDFGAQGKGYFCGKDFQQDGFMIRFNVVNVPFELKSIGRHNMLNALAATAAVSDTGVTLAQAAEALATFAGIYRRTQVVAVPNGVTVVDDFAHNPAEVAAAIRACQNISSRVFAWFQPHGYGPLRFMHEELSEKLIDTLRDSDTVILSDVYYAGGTVQKDINSAIVTDEVSKHKSALFVADRTRLAQTLRPLLKRGDTVLLMGARDPYLGDFARELAAELL